MIKTILIVALNFLFEVLTDSSISFCQTTAPRLQPSSCCQIPELFNGTLLTECRVQYKSEDILRVATVDVSFTLFLRIETIIWLYFVPVFSPMRLSCRQRKCIHTNICWWTISSGHSKVYLQQWTRISKCCNFSTVQMYKFQIHFDHKQHWTIWRKICLWP